MSYSSLMSYLPFNLTWGYIAIPASLLFIFLLKRYYNGPMHKNSKPMTGKTVIVTGSNAGIGKVTALDLLRNGAKVIFAARDEVRTLAVINDIKDPKMKQNAFFIKLDLSSLSSIESFAKEFDKSFSSLDILVNNAGATFDSFSKIQGVDKTMVTNLIGPVYLTCLLLKKFNPKGKVINLSSMYHAFTTQKEIDHYLSDLDFHCHEKGYNYLPIYQVSKLGNIYHTKHLTQYFKEKGLELKSAAIHPGWVRSDFSTKFATFFMKLQYYFVMVPTSWIFAKDVVHGAQTTLHACYLDYDKMNSGDYYRDCHVGQLKQLASSEEYMKKYMDYTYKLILKMKDRNSLPEEVIEYFENTKKKI
jgi:retinol dehydrogenase-12